MRFPGPTHLVICCRGQCGRSTRHDAGHHGEAEVNGERDEDAGLQAAGREVRFSGVHVWALLLAETGRTYLGTVPAKKRVIRICEAIGSETGRDRTLLDQETVVGKLNRMMTGWANYFCLGPVSKAYRAVERHARKRLRQWLCAKHKVGPRTGKFPAQVLHDELGLVRLSTRTRSFPWATS